MSLVLEPVPLRDWIARSPYHWVKAPNRPLEIWSGPACGPGERHLVADGERSRLFPAMVDAARRAALGMVDPSSPVTWIPGLASSIHQVSASRAPSRTSTR